MVVGNGACGGIDIVWPYELYGIEGAAYEVAGVRALKHGLVAQR